MGVGSVPVDSADSTPSSPAVVSTGSHIDGTLGSEPVATANIGLAGPPVQRASTNNTTTRLVFPRDEVEQEQFATVRIGLGSTLQSEREKIRYARHRITIEREFEAAESLEDERSVIDQGIIELREQVRALEARERTAIHDYSNGTISAETLLERLARIDAAARQIETTLALLDRLSDNSGISRFDSPIKGIGALVGPLQGPVRNRVSRTVAGETSPKRVFVTGSETGVVLSMLAGGTYYREATELSNRRPNEENNVHSPWDRAEELYPWAHANAGLTDLEGALTVNSYFINIAHSQGSLFAYMDTGSADIYREVQTFRLRDIATTDPIDRRNGDLNLVLRRTYVGGPLFVYLEDAGTGAAVDARVTVDGHEVGHTGADGLVRTIEPRAPYTVNVSIDEVQYEFEIDSAVQTSED